MLEVITFGEPLVLFTPKTRGLLRHQKEFTKSIGGTELNTAIGLSRLGISCGWFGRIGDDEFGSEVLAVLQAEGVDTSRVKHDKDYPTGVMFKQYRGLVDPNVLYYRSTSAARQIAPVDVDESYFTGVKFLHLTGITAAISDSAKDTVMHSIKVATDSGCKISFDPNIRRKFMDMESLDVLMLPIISKSYALFVGVEEGHLLFGVKSPKAIAAAAHSLGVSIVAVKMGSSGSYVSSSEGAFRESGFPVSEVVDTVGAGDGYNAGFLASLCRGESLSDAARLASITGAFAVTVQSDYEGYPTLAEAESIRRGEKSISR